MSVYIQLGGSSIKTFYSPIEIALITGLTILGSIIILGFDGFKQVTNIIFNDRIVKESEKKLCITFLQIFSRLAISIAVTFFLINLIQLLRLDNHIFVWKQLAGSFLLLLYGFILSELIAQPIKYCILLRTTTNSLSKAAEPQKLETGN